MESLLFRTGSGPLAAQTPPAHSSPRHSVTLPIHDSGEKSGGVSFHRISLPQRNMRRVSSDPDLTRSSSERNNLSKLGSRSFTDVGHAGDSQSTGGGKNMNRNLSGGRSDGDDQRKIGAYYEEMVRTNPSYSLILRNYGKYLHEVEKNVVKAEEYYSRAILASPGDGEVLSLYAKLTWETKKDKTRANFYFIQALQASPNDSTILGSYAHFLWETEEDEDEETSQGEVAVPAMVEAC